MLSRKAGVSPHPQGDTGGVFSQGLLLPCESSRVRRPRPPKPLERHRRSAPCPSASRASASRVPVTRPSALPGHRERTAPAHPHRVLAHPVGARQPHQQRRPHPPGGVSACRPRAPCPQDTPPSLPRGGAPRVSRGERARAPAASASLRGTPEPAGDARRAREPGISTWCLEVTLPGRGPRTAEPTALGPLAAAQRQRRGSG